MYALLLFFVNPTLQAAEPATVVGIYSSQGQCEAARVPVTTGAQAGAAPGYNVISWCVPAKPVVR